MYGKRKKASEIAKMPASILTDVASVQYITADVFKEIVAAKALPSMIDRQKLANNVLDYLRILALAGPLAPEQDLILKMLGPAGSNQKMKDEFGL